MNGWNLLRMLYKLNENTYSPPSANWKKLSKAWKARSILKLAENYEVSQGTKRVRKREKSKRILEFSINACSK